MKSYQELLTDVLTNGVRQENRTGVATLSVFGRTWRHDLSKGFPLLTTKKIPWKGVCAEDIWIWRGETTLKFLHDYGVKVWDANAGSTDDDADLGPVYGKQMRRVVVSEWVEPVLYEDAGVFEPDFDKTVEVDFSLQATSLIGKTLDMRDGPCTVIKEIPPSNSTERTRLLVKFHRTGSVRNVAYGDFQKGQLIDRWAPRVESVGRYGDYDENDPDAPMLLTVWRDMLDRCYDKNSTGYPGYGGAGVHVGREWQVFANFLKEAKKIPNWLLKKEYPALYSIDKDARHASNRYCLENCMWATKEEQSLNTSTGTPFMATSPDGNPVMFRSFGEATRLHGLNVSAVHRCLNGKLRTHHGWSNFTYLYESGRVLRTRITDQLRQVVASLIHDPNSRRHLITLWNPSEIDKMKLPPCHGIVIQFNVSDGKLNCAMYQRSADLLLGVPWNIASYALLTSLLARRVGLEPGELVISFGDLHLYENHLDQAREQLMRDPRPLPQLVVLNERPELELYLPEDLAVEEYDPHPAIKAEMAV